jgi:FkbM family methyltransferase
MLIMLKVVTLQASESSNNSLIVLWDIIFSFAHKFNSLIFDPMGFIRNFLDAKLMQRFRRQSALLTGMYLKLKKLNATTSDDFRTAQILNTFGFDLVLDIGANTGQFAESLLDFGYKGRVVSFEPTSKAYELLQKRAAKYKQWTVAVKCAIGNFDGDVEINLSYETQYNSIKTIKNNINQYIEQYAKETVKIYKMDSLKDKYYSNKDKIFLKTDTQGFEKEVLEGSLDLLDKVDGVKLESPLQAIYNDVQWGFKDIVDFFYRKGFVVVSSESLTANYKNGTILELDLIFLKKELFENFKN